MISELLHCKDRKVLLHLPPHAQSLDKHRIIYPRQCHSDLCIFLHKDSPGQMNQVPQ